MTTPSTRRCHGRGALRPRRHLAPRTCFPFAVAIAIAVAVVASNVSILFPASVEVDRGRSTASFGLLFASAMATMATGEEDFDEGEEDADDFLAEMLAEEAKDEEEHARVQAEARERDALIAERRRAEHMNGGGGAGTGTGGGGMPSGMPGAKMNEKMNGMGGRKNAGRSMPKGAKPAGSGFDKLEEQLHKKEERAAEKKAERAEEEEADVAEKVRLRREAEFEAKLKKMNDEQRKLAKKQKLKDARTVKRILKAAKAKKHYAALGLRNLEVQVGPFRAFKRTAGPFVLFKMNTKTIKRAYRNMARTVHPDKNQDGRAEEAFHALETCAGILTDEKKRSEYDRRLLAARRRRNADAADKVMGASRVAWNRAGGALGATKKVLGPFSTPILVISALII